MYSTNYYIESLEFLHYFDFPAENRSPYVDGTYFVKTTSDIFTWKQKQTLFKMSAAECDKV